MNGTVTVCLTVLYNSVAWLKLLCVPYIRKYFNLSQIFNFDRQKRPVCRWSARFPDDKIKNRTTTPTEQLTTTTIAHGTYDHHIIHISIITNNFKINYSSVLMHVNV